jgi:2'-5' RNA ligase
MQRIRSFVSIPLPGEIKNSVSKFIRKLARDDDGVRWVPDDQLSLLLKHLGDVENVEVPQICTVIRDVLEDVEPFELIFAGVGGFPGLDKPRTLYAGIEDPTGRLCQVVESLEIELAELGFKREPRDYRPHLPIGRVKGSRKRVSEAMVDALKDLPDPQFGEMIADEVEMIGSFLDKHGPSYHVMDTIEF